MNNGTKNGEQNQMNLLALVSNHAQRRQFKLHSRQEYSGNFVTKNAVRNLSRDCHKFGRNKLDKWR